MVDTYSVADNLVLNSYNQTPFSRGISVDVAAIRRHAQAMIDSFNVKTPSQETPLKNLSGGNIQKMILARELSRQPRVLIAAQPTSNKNPGVSHRLSNIHRIPQKYAEPICPK